jgi:hypothetical protein
MVSLSLHVETIEIHDLVPPRDKVVHELLLGILASVDFRCAAAAANFP